MLSAHAQPTSLDKRRSITRLQFTVSVLCLEGAPLENSLCLQKTVHLNLAILDADLIVDCEVVTARLGGLDLRHDDLQGALAGEACIRIVDDVLLLIPLGRRQGTDRLVQLNHLSLQRRLGLAVQGLRGLLFLCSFGSVLQNVLVDHPQDSDDSRLLLNLASIRCIPRRRRRWWCFASLAGKWLVVLALLLCKHETVLTVELAEHVLGAHDQRSSVLVVLLRGQVLSLLIVADPFRLVQLLVDRCDLLFLVLNLGSNLFDLRFVCCDGVTQLIHGTGCLYGIACVRSAVGLARLFLLQI
mmetsp:Transcript_146887/g.366336  ORF Transcript_146887/g.366336 Transcript_146887/m.366336 type:complete len:299 (-) Transcript_146887:850-1746(-)